MATRGAMRQWRKAVNRHRRLLAAVLAAGAMTAALSALRTEPPPTIDVVVAAKDLTAGVNLRAADLTTAALPETAKPAGTVLDTGQLVGQVLAAPVRRGEPVTDVRLVGSSNATRYGEGKVGAPVRVADPGVGALLRPGSVVDILAVDSATELDSGGPATVIASRVRVVSAPNAAQPTANGDALVVVAATPAQAKRLAKHGAQDRLTVTLHDR